MTKPISLLFIGFGNMATAIADGMAGIEHIRISYIDNHQHQTAPSYRKLSINNAENKHFDAVILATKPQVMADILQQYNVILNQTPLIISIAAGKKLSFYHQHLSANKAIIRVMPNTPARVGKAVSVGCANMHASNADKALTYDIFNTIGQCFFVDNDSDMDSVTALSGSGSAYVFAFIEAMRDAGIQAGLSANLAQNLALYTIEGAAILASTTQEDPAILRTQVTSKGGTTQAGLSVLCDKEHGLSSLMARTIAAAKQRSISLNHQ